jgi:NAD(P)-dependent dehydrogenase (short-subunit alcohol dehydrogenase family)
MSHQNKWTVENIPDQDGKIVIVTGANSGLGFEASRALAQHGATVIMACRSLEKGEAAAGQIRSASPRGQCIVRRLDLSDLSSVQEFAESCLNEYKRLDILINNAGVMAIPYRKTVDGFEMQFCTNHLGHFKLTGLLIGVLMSTPESRVVTVTSYAHFFGRINFRDLNGERFYQKWLAYCQSKLANVLFGYELQRRAVRHGAQPVSIVAHPGYAATNLQHSSWLFTRLNPVMAQSQEMGALPILYAATSPALRGGEYIGPDGFLGQRGYPHKTWSSPSSHSLETARRLWEISEQLTGIQLSLA